MASSRRLWIFILVFVLLAICLLLYLFMTGERGLSGNPPALRKLDVTRLSAAETERLGWSPERLDTAFDHAAGLSSDVLRRAPLHTAPRVRGAAVADRAGARAIAMAEAPAFGRAGPVAASLQAKPGIEA